MEETKKYHLCSREAEESAKRLFALGLQACYMCGRLLEICDKEAEELGFDECEYMAGK